MNTYLSGLLTAGVALVIASGIVATFVGCIAGVGILTEPDMSAEGYERFDRFCKRGLLIGLPLLIVGSPMIPVLVHVYGG